MTRFTVVGSGEALDRYLAAGRLVRDVELFGVDLLPDPLSSPEFQAAISQPDVDAVVVCAPIEQRFTIASQAARAGKHLLIESPAAFSIEEATLLATICGQQSVTLTVLEPQRHRPLLQAVQATIAAGTLGLPRYVHLTSIWHWPATDAGSGDDRGFLLEYATGAIDAALWLMAEPVQHVFARACSNDDPEAPVRYVSILLTFPEGAQAICEVGRASRLAPRTGLQNVTVIGTGGSAHHDLRKTDVVVGPAGMRPIGDDTVEGIAAALSVWSPETAGAGFEQSRVALHWALAAAESLETGLPVGEGR